MKNIMKNGTLSAMEKSSSSGTRFERPGKPVPASHILHFPADSAAPVRANFRKAAGLKRPGIFALVLAAHIAVLLIAVFLSIRPSGLGYGPVTVIDLMNMEEMPAPAAGSKKAPALARDEQRLLVKDENKPAEPEEAAADAGEGDSTGKGVAGGTGTGDGNFLPQGKIGGLPGIPVARLQANMVYPPMALKMGLEALVLLELFIDQNGNIIRITVLKDPGHGFAEAALKAFEGISVTPATVNGKPAAVRFRYPVRFTLK